jgi:O-antigen/teichoic acid export membrane protein
MGLYYFADKIRDSVMNLIVNSVITVSYPALSTLQADSARLKESYRKLIITTTFLTFPFTTLLAALAPDFFDALLPAAWTNSAAYLQLMCIAALLFPLHSINLNILKVTDRSDLVLYVGILKKAVTITIFIFTLQFGITEVLIGQIMASLISYAPNAYYLKKLIGDSLTEQLVDFLPALILACMTAALIYFLLSMSPLMPLANLILFESIGLFLYVIGSHLLN